MEEGLEEHRYRQETVLTFFGLGEVRRSHLGLGDLGMHGGSEGRLELQILLAWMF